MVDYSNLIQSRKIMIEMLTDRGFDMKMYYDKDGDVKILTLNEIKNKLNENNIQIIVGKNDNKTCILFFDKKIGIELVKEIISNIIPLNLNRLILVVKDKLTSFAKKELQNLPISFEIEIFLQQEVLFNVTHHEFVPKHILLTDKEDIKDIYETYGTSLPRISKTDKISRYYGAKVGQIFKILRKNTIYYRLVY